VLLVLVSPESPEDLPSRPRQLVPAGARCPDDQGRALRVSRFGSVDLLYGVYPVRVDIHRLAQAVYSALITGPAHATL
jgi:hypothetical protein